MAASASRCPRATTKLEAAHLDYAGPQPNGGAMPGVMVYPEMETTAEVTPRAAA